MSFRAKITFSVLGWTSRTHTHALSHPPLPLSHLSLSLSLSLYLSLSHTHMFECFFISRVSATVWKRHWSEEDVCCVFVRRSFQTISFFVFACLWSDRVDWWPHCKRALLTSALLTSALLWFWSIDFAVPSELSCFSWSWVARLFSKQAFFFR